MKRDGATKNEWKVLPILCMVITASVSVGTFRSTPFAGMVAAAPDTRHPAQKPVANYIIYHFDSVYARWIPFFLWRCGKMWKLGGQSHSSGEEWCFNMIRRQEVLSHVGSFPFLYFALFIYCGLRRSLFFIHHCTNRFFGEKSTPRFL